jgi:hypothetical protein
MELTATYVFGGIGPAPDAQRLRLVLDLHSDARIARMASNGSRTEFMLQLLLRRANVAAS